MALSALSSCGTPPPRPGPPHRGDQATFQQGVAKDRGQLFDGRLDYASRFTTSVGVPRTFRIDLTALSDEASRRTSMSPTLTGSRPFQVGGVEGAALTATSGAVQTKPLADSRTRQVIALPGDRVEWWWSVSASEPGDYELLLTLTTYQGDSDRALYTLAPPIRVHLHVADTWSHRVDSMLSTILAWGGAAVALTALLAFRAPIATFVRTRRDAWRERNRDAHQDGYR